MGSLAALAEQIENFINAIPNNDSHWSSGGFNISTFGIARVALDPMTIFEDSKPRLWIMPVVMDYSIAKGNKRGRTIHSILRSPLISIIISAPFCSFQKEDVAQWTEVKRILNFREDIDGFIIRDPWDYALEEVTAEPPQEIEMNQRWFLSITEFRFEETRCP